MFQYKAVVATDIPDMIRLYKTYLNDGDVIDEQITKDFYTEGFVGVKCVNDHNKMIGVVSAFPGVEFTCGHQPLVQEIQRAYGQHCIYTTEMIVVLPAYRHLHIGEIMVKAFYKALEATDAEYFIIELWKEPNGRVPGRLMTHIFGGEIKHYSMPMFYKDLAAYGLTCPICGDQCVCGAEISLLSLRKKGRSMGHGRSQKKVHQS